MTQTEIRRSSRIARRAVKQGARPAESVRYAVKKLATGPTPTQLPTLKGVSLPSQGQGFRVEAASDKDDYKTHLILTNFNVHDSSRLVKVKGFRSFFTGTNIHFISKIFLLLQFFYRHLL